MNTKRFTLGAVLVAALLLSTTMATADHHETTKPVLRHVVSFKFKDTATKEQITEIVEAFAALPGKIPEIRAFEWGTNNSPEKHDKGFTHVFILTFNSEADRTAYLPHPAHKAFGQKLGPIIEDVFVVDYWTGK